MRSATMKELAPISRVSNNFHCLRLTLKLFNGNAQGLEFETFAYSTENKILVSQKIENLVLEKNNM